MKKSCVFCGDIATKVDFNNDNYCAEHICQSSKKEKKIKRFHLNDDVYWLSVKKAAERNMDVRTYIIDLINKDFSRAS